MASGFPPTFGPAKVPAKAAACVNDMSISTPQRRALPLPAAPGHGAYDGPSRTRDVTLC
jgi:hypothetical protein